MEVVGTVLIGEDDRKLFGLMLNFLISGSCFPRLFIKGCCSFLTCSEVGAKRKQALGDCPLLLMMERGC